MAPSCRLRSPPARGLAGPALRPRCSHGFRPPGTHSRCDPGALRLGSVWGHVCLSTRVSVTTATTGVFLAWRRWGLGTLPSALSAQDAPKERSRCRARERLADEGHDGTHGPGLMSARTDDAARGTRDRLRSLPQQGCSRGGHPRSRACKRMASSLGLVRQGPRCTPPPRPLPSSC